MSERLRRSAEVRAVLSHGLATHGAHAVLRCRRREDDGPSRWTVSAGRRVGPAVRRNRAKRRLRAVLRELPLVEGADLVVIARASAVDCEFDELRDDVHALVARCEVVEVVG